MMIAIVLAPAVAGAVSPAQFGQEWQKRARQDLESARTYCEGFVNNAKLQVEAQICLANVIFEQSKTKKVADLQISRSALIVSPVYVYDPKKLDEAISHLDAALAIDPARLDVWKGKAFILQSTGRHEQLLAHLSLALTKCPGIGPRDLSGYARTYGEQEEWDKAADVFQLLVKKFPDDFLLNFDYGVSLAQTGHLEEALVSLKKAENIKVDEPTLAALANLYLYLNRFTEALPYLEKLAKQNPDQEIDQVRYLLCLAIVKPDQAPAQAKKIDHPSSRGAEAISVVVPAIDPVWARAEAAKALSRHEMDMTMLFAGLAGDHPEVARIRGEAYIQLNADALAIDQLTQYVSGKPDEALRAQTEFDLGLACFREKKFSVAEKYLREAIGHGKGDAESYFFLGSSLDEQGKAKEAQESYRRAQESNPKDDLQELIKQRIKP